MAGIAQKWPRRRDACCGLLTLWRLPLLSLSIHLIPYFQGALVLSSLSGPSNEAMTKEETASERTRSLARPTSSQPKYVFLSNSTIRKSF